MQNIQTIYKTSHGIRSSSSVAIIVNLFLRENTY